MEVECEICGKVMNKKDYPNYNNARFAAKRFCSKQCMWKDKAYRKLMAEAVRKSNEHPSEKQLASAKRMGQANKGKHRSSETEYKPGKLHPQWKGGTRKYRGADWTKQRQKALERDKHICQRCGFSGNEVHHIIPYSTSKDNSLENLMTLCKRCHIIHERGYSALVVYGDDIVITHVPIKALEQFIEFSNNEFNGNKAMALKHLIDGQLTNTEQFVLTTLDNHESRIVQLEHPQRKQTPELKMLDGTVRKVTT